METKLLVESCAVILILCFLDLLTGFHVSQDDNEIDQLVMKMIQKELDYEADLLGCHVRKYEHFIDKSIVLETGVELRCFDNVTVDACWGSCDSYEIPDYNLPYKISHHPVCLYDGKIERYVTLRNCHSAHPDPTVLVFDAINCQCATCNSESTNCEHLVG